MTWLIGGLLGAALALACLPAAGEARAGGPGGTRPLAVEDIVSTAAFGRATISPGGRWAVYEKRGPYDSAPRFDLGPRSQWAITDLWLVDLTDGSARPERLLAGEPPGLVRGPWSPSGARMLVQRLRGDRLEFGVVTMADRSVRWTGLTPEMPQTGVAAQWLSDDRLVLMVRPEGRPPWLLRYYGGAGPASEEAWRLTAGGKAASRTVWNAAGGVAEAAEAPDGQALVLLDLATGRVRTMARGQLRDMSASSDGRVIAVLEAGPSVPVEAGRVVQMEVPHRQRLRLFAVDGGTALAPDDGRDVAPHLLRWSSDSSQLLVWARRDGEPWRDGELLRVGRDGAVAVVPRHGVAPGPGAVEIDILRGAQADWLGGTPVLYGRGPGEARFDWHLFEEGAPPRALTRDIAAPDGRIAAVAPEGLLVFGDDGLWILNRDGARRVSPTGLPARAVAIGDIEAPFRARFNTPPHQSWAAATGPDGAIHVLGSDGSQRRLGGAGRADARVLAAGPGVSLVVGHAGLVESLELRSEAGASVVDTVNAHLADVALVAPRPVAHRDLSGRETRSWLFLPGGCAAAAARGLVVDVYPGSVDDGTWSGPMSLTYGLRAAVLAGAGYAVLSPSLPIDRPEARSAGRHAQALDLAVDAALAACPALDPDRIAVVGHSYGATVAMQVATVSTRYRSYVAWAGTSLTLSKWGEFIPATRALAADGHMMRNQQGWIESGQGGPSGLPWSDLQTYVADSPYLAADRIAAPVLLITADRDYVPMSQSELMFSALYRVGGRVRLVAYHGEDHSLWSPANIRDVYGQIFLWFEETLAAPRRAGRVAGQGSRKRRPRSRRDRASRAVPSPGPRMRTWRSSSGAP